MCGIVAAAAQRNVAAILLEGLKRLEYRGYDSAGMAVLGAEGLQCRRHAGKVALLAEDLARTPFHGHLGIAHTRWATHGRPSEVNAHPHRSGPIAVVHNGIIENFRELRAELEADGYQFSSETDTEVIAHLIHRFVREKGFVDFVSETDTFCRCQWYCAPGQSIRRVHCSHRTAASRRRPNTPCLGRYGEYSCPSGLLRHHSGCAGARRKRLVCAR